MNGISKLGLVLALTLATAACSRGDAFEIPAGSDVTVQKHDGVEVHGRLVEVQASQVVLESRDGVKTLVPRSEIRTIAAAPARQADGTPAPAGDAVGAAGPAESPRAGAEDSLNPIAKLLDREPAYREVTIPAGTLLPVTLQSNVASDTSHVEDPVRATLRRAVTIDGVQALPAGTAVLGHVTAARESAKVKGRASVALRFSELDLPGDAGRTRITTAAISRVAPATKREDAAKIGAGAAGGAIVGGIIGGGSGAAKGAAVGGAAGTGVVLATRGKEVRLGPGVPLSVRLTSPLTVRIPVK
jgi:hypothetical protein